MRYTYNYIRIQCFACNRVPSIINIWTDESENQTDAVECARTIAGSCPTCGAKPSVSIIYTREAPDWWKPQRQVQ